MSGKTWLSFSCFAEVVLNPNFKNYRLIYDDVEGGALMDVARYFGKGVVSRLESPGVHKGLPVHSDTVESFYYHVHDALKAGRPFIYVLDSQDALTSDASSTKFLKQKKADEEGKEAAGSYGDGKAKYHSEHIRHVLAGIRKTGSILIIIGQTRDNIGFGFDPKTRAGGKALRFYANLEIWSSVKGKIQRTVRGKPRTLGTHCLVEVKKNRVTGKVGKDRTVEIPIYFDYGIDDVGSCIDYLVAEKHWEKNDTGQIDAADLLLEGSRERLAIEIEKEGMEGKVRKLAAKVWEEIDAECALKRKPRYA